MGTQEVVIDALVDRTISTTNRNESNMVGLHMRVHEHSSTAMFCGQYMMQCGYRSVMFKNIYASILSLYNTVSYTTGFKQTRQNNKWFSEWNNILSIPGAYKKFES